MTILAGRRRRRLAIERFGAVAVPSSAVALTVVPPAVSSLISIDTLSIELAGGVDALPPVKTKALAFDAESVVVQHFAVPHQDMAKVLDRSHGPGTRYC